MLVARKLSQEDRYQQYENNRQSSFRSKRRVKKCAAVEKLVITGCVILALAVGLLFTATQAMVTERSAKITQIKTEITDLQNANERLKLEIARLKSLDRIEMIAMTELGMVQPELSSIQFIAVDDRQEENSQVAFSPTAVNNNGKVEVKNGEKMHPALQAVSQMVTNYVFGVRNVEASEL
ncbi:MAG: septum formation initiator family protein [Bacillota bacterium]|nr:hypothetical protein [Clostridia bacterium]